MGVNYVLEAKYDELAFEFLRLGVGQKEQLFLDSKSMREMQVNLPLENGIRTPASCDVLTTYIALTDPVLVGALSQIVDDIVSVFHGGQLDCYRVPLETYHISLVMLHDVRPADMANEAMRSAVLPEEDIAHVTENMGKIRRGQFKLTLYGIRFGRDGAVFAVIMDDGGTLKLRRAIGDAVSAYLRPQFLKYDKPFIHTTLLRILEPITRDTLYELQRKQRELFYLIPRNLAIPVDRFHLARETRWGHTQLDHLVSFELT